MFINIKQAISIKTGVGEIKITRRILKRLSFCQLVSLRHFLADWKGSHTAEERARSTSYFIQIQLQSYLHHVADALSLSLSFISPSFFLKLAMQMLARLQYKHQLQDFPPQLQYAKIQQPQTSTTQSDCSTLRSDDFLFFFFSLITNFHRI